MKSLRINSSQFRNIAIGIFFLISGYCVWDVSRFTKQLALETKNESLQLVRNESQSLRKETLQYLSDTSLLIDARLASVQKTLDYRLSSIEEKANSRFISIENRAFQSLDTFDSNSKLITQEAILLSQDYRKVPKYLSLFDKELDCSKNDFCWQNLTTDTLISTRNVSIDANKTFLMLNENVPRWTSDFSKVSTSISTGVPKIVDNATDISAGVNRIIRPRWYDRLIGWGINSGLIWMNMK